MYIRDSAVYENIYRSNVKLERRYFERFPGGAGQSWGMGMTKIYSIQV